MATSETPENTTPEPTTPPPVFYNCTYQNDSGFIILEDAQDASYHSYSNSSAEDYEKNPDLYAGK